MEKKDGFVVFEDGTKIKEPQFLSMILDSLPLEIFLKTLDGTYLYVNQTLADNDRIPREQIIGKRDQDLYPPQVYPIFTETDKEVAIRGKEISFTHDNIDEKILKTYKALFPKDGEMPQGILGYSLDVTELVGKIKTLEKEQNKYKGIFENSPLGVAVYHTISCQALEINPMFCEITGRTREELMTLPWESYSHPDEIEENLQFMKLLTEHKIDGFNMEKRFIRPDNTEVWVHMTIQRYSDEDNRDAHLVMITDISDRKEAEAKAAYYFDHDQLTGLYNRKYIDEKMKELDSPDHWPLSIIMADANGLKMTNDAFGHMEGDRILKELARIFTEAARPEDFVARTGGDEFMMLMPGTTGNQALQMMTRINQAKDQEKEQSLLLSMSMGCATKVSAAESIESVFQAAEARMYHSKITESNAYKVKIIHQIQDMLFQRNPSEKEHCERVRDHAVALGESAGIRGQGLEELSQAAMLHDIGKVGVDGEVLNKNEGLSKGEWAKVMKHPEVGYQILRGVPEYGKIAEYVLYHHERVDGVGYPVSLSIEDIPIQSKILGLAEAYVDMTSQRPYRGKMSKEEAMDEIKRGAGTQFDPELVTLFLEEVIPQLNP
jgi:diguanylate cyclase (GGDEF)-like protein/PAS domain S-box-containing protein